MRRESARLSGLLAIGFGNLYFVERFTNWSVPPSLVPYVPLLPVAALMALAVLANPTRTGRNGLWVAAAGLALISAATLAAVSYERRYLEPEAARWWLYATGLSLYFVGPLMVAGGLVTFGLTNRHRNGLPRWNSLPFWMAIFSLFPFALQASRSFLLSSTWIALGYLLAFDDGWGKQERQAEPRSSDGA